MGRRTLGRGYPRRLVEGEAAHDLLEPGGAVEAVRLLVQGDDRRRFEDGVGGGNLIFVPCWPGTR